MGEDSTVKHINLGTKFRVKFERAATKGIIGFCVEATDDNEAVCFEAADRLRQKSEAATPIQPGV